MVAVIVVNRRSCSPGQSKTFKAAIMGSISLKMYVIIFKGKKINKEESFCLFKAPMEPIRTIRTDVVLNDIAPTRRTNTISQTQQHKNA